jgi:caffeoyl-CoA O-methyltransferase
VVAVRRGRRGGSGPSGRGGLCVGQFDSAGRRAARTGRRDARGGRRPGRNAVEVGTFTGYSSTCIARGLAAGGRLLACDVSEEWTSIARRYWEKAGVADRVDLKIGPAIETLRALPEDFAIDFAFIDADKESYPAYYEELVRRLRPGGVIALDNVLRGGRVLDPAFDDAQYVTMRRLNTQIATDERVDAVMLPLRDGVTVIRKR